MSRGIAARWRRVVSALLAVACLLPPAPAASGELWRRHAGSDVPWVEPQAIASFENRLFVSANGSADGDATRLWRSADGESWEAVHFFDQRIVQSYCVHDGALYAMSVETTNARRVYRTKDGDAWERADTGEFGTGAWSDAVSLDDWIVVAARPGAYWRSSGFGQPPRWEPMPAPPPPSPNLSPHHVILAEQNGDLVAGQVFTYTGGTKRPQFYASPDAWTWPDEGNTPEPFLHREKLNVANFKHYLVWGGQNVKIRSGSFWAHQSLHGDPVPFVLHDRLFILNPGNNILQNVRIQGFGAYAFLDHASPPYCEANRERYSNVAHLGDRAYFLPCDLWSLKKGIHALALEPVAPKPLSFDLVNEPVLIFSVSVSLEETLTALSVRQNGTAIAGRDIAAMRLVDARTFQPISELTRDPAGRRWSLPDGFLHAIEGDAIFGILVDIGTNPAEGTEIELAVERLTWRESNSYAAPAEIATGVFTIATPNPALTAPIENVLTYPNPARDTVHLAFNLEEISDVSVALFDRAGAAVLRGVANGISPDPRAAMSLDVSGLAPGVYVATINIRGAAGGERRYRRKVTVER